MNDTPVVTVRDILGAGWDYESQGRDVAQGERWKRHRSRLCPSLLKFERWHDETGRALPPDYVADGQSYVSLSEAIDALNKPMPI